jgi:arginyl-tRNA synthetase
MQISSDIKQAIQTALSQVDANIATKTDVASIHLEHPKSDVFGDYSTNIAMQLAPILKKSPMDIAAELITHLEKSLPPFIKKIETAPPGFINFSLTDEWLQQQITQIITKEAKTEQPLYSNIGQNEPVIIEYSSPNIAKPMSIGHFRTTVLGDSLKRIYKSLGYNTISFNHIGDWGVQFGILLYAYKRFGDKTKVEHDPIGELNKLYVEFHRLMADQPALKRKGRIEFRKLEEGDKENRELWQWFKDVSMKEFHAMYQTLGIEPFDYELGESFYIDKMQAEVDELIKKKIATKGSAGEIYVDLEQEKLGRFIVKKSDGSSIYGTRDLATYRYRKAQFDFTKMVYVVGNEQSHYFRQLFRVLELLGFDTPNQAVHVNYGLVKLASGEKMSTRKGNTITSKDLVDRAIKKALAHINEKNPNLPNKEEVAAQVGIGALKYINLFQNRITEIKFDWDQALSYEGNTGPYIQYTYARLKSILRKEQPSSTADISLLTDEREHGILRILYRLGEAAEVAAKEFAPNFIAEYLHTLASAANDYYAHTPILKAEQNIKKARLLLIQAIAIQLEDGLSLLGIEAPEEM